MTHDEAEHVLGTLIGATTGWGNAPDETFRFYLAQLELLRDRDAALEAVIQVGNTWTEARRPPMAVVNTAYQSILTQRAMRAPALPAADRHVATPAAGRSAAHAAYLKECARQGKEPRPAVVDAMLSNIGSSS